MSEMSEMNEAIPAPVDPLSSGWDYPSPHRLAVCPQPADIDGLNHTNNAVYVKWCEQVAWSHSVALGLDIEDYRRLDYFEKWTVGVSTLVVEKGLVSRDEIDAKVRQLQARLENKR